MNMYIGDYWAPFPSSEYGGMWVVMAENEEQVIDILEGTSYDDRYEDLIPEAVSKAKVFPLDKNETFKPQLIENFYT
jgi:hypothetical protein